MSRMLRSLVAVLTVLTLAVIGAAVSGPAIAGQAPQHVVNATDIQARIDQQLNREDAARQQIQLMLQRQDIREIAARVGLDLQRAGAAAALLSGEELAALATQATALNADVEGSGNVVISATAIIIILLIIIIVAN